MLCSNSIRKLCILTFLQLQYLLPQPHHFFSTHSINLLFSINLLLLEFEDIYIHFSFAVKHAIIYIQMSKSIHFNIPLLQFNLKSLHHFYSFHLLFQKFLFLSPFHQLPKYLHFLFALFILDHTKQSLFGYIICNYLFRITHVLFCPHFAA